MRFRFATSVVCLSLLAVSILPEAAEAQSIVDVGIAGNSRVEQSAIQVHIDALPGGSLDVDQVNADVKEIYGMGFFDNVWVTAEDTARGVRLIYHVSERPYIEEIRFVGVENADEEDLEAVINVTPRTIFDPRRVAEGLEQARKFYSGEGYPDAAIDFQLERGDENVATLVYKVDEGDLIRVVNINFEGVTAFEKKELRRLMTTRTEWWLSFFTGAGLLNEDELNTDIERITAYYYDQGYIQARVDEPRVERTEDGLEVTIKVQEGPLFSVGEISFAGDLLMTDPELRNRLRLAEGDVFRASLVRESVFSVTEAYGDLGYAFAEVVPETRPASAEDFVDIRFRITSGDIVSIRRIEIRGNTKTRDYVIRRELELHEGETYSGSGLRRSKAEVRRLGFFDEVELTTQKSDREDQVDLVVDVKEGRTGAFSAGAGFSSADSLLFNARISEQNLFGRGQRLVLNADVGSIRQNFQLGFTEPWFGNRPLAVGFDVFDWQLDFDRFTRGGTGFGLRASYPLRELGFESVGAWSLDHVRAGLQYRLERAKIEGFDNLAPPSVLNQAGKTLTSSVIPTLTRNTLDHPFDPTRGSRQILQAEFAGFGGDAEFVKLEASGRWFFPLLKILGGRQLVYSFAGNIGYGIGEESSGRVGGDSDELPIFERYFPGGINSVRGFDSRSMGPRELACGSTPVSQECRFEEIGGSHLLVFNNELILPLVPDAGIKGVVFFDAGNAFLAEDGYDFGNLRYAAGWGIRWLSPFGPLRIEIGYNLDPEEDEDRSVVLFSFGSPF